MRRCPQVTEAAEGHGLVEGFDSFKVPVDEVVQQPIEEKGDAVGGQVLRGVPQFDDWLVVESGIFANRGKGPAGDERGDLLGVSRPDAGSSPAEWADRNR
jgi:hypothetical protein